MKGHMKIKVKVHNKNGKKNHKKMWKIAAVAFKSGSPLSAGGVSRCLLVHGLLQYAYRIARLKKDKKS